MQQAYFQEAVAYGGWKLIGYVAPGQDGQTSNFTYASEGLDDDATTQDAVDKIWYAHNKGALNECESGDNWIIAASAVSDGSTSTVLTATVADSECKSLTPTFENIK